MKKSLVLLLCLIGVCSTQAQPREDFRKKGAPIPPFIIEQPNGKLFNSSILKPGKPSLIAIFAPQCDHCELALDTLRRFGRRLSNMNVVLVTEARHKAHVKPFLTKNGFDTVSAFRQAGIDKGNLIYFIYNYGLLPQFNIYDARHKLVKSFSGAFPMDSLKLYLH